MTPLIETAMPEGVLMQLILNDGWTRKAVHHGLPFNVQTSEITDLDIADALRSAKFPSLFHACGFRTISVMDTDTSERDLVEIVVILDTDEWSDAAAEACRRTSLICADALGPLGLLSLPICRTRAEHEEAIAVETDIWRMIDHTKPC